MKIMFRAVESPAAKGYGGKKDYDNPNFRMQMASSAGAPIRSMIISGGMKGGVLPGMLEMASGHFFRGIWKMFTWSDAKSIRLHDEPCVPLHGAGQAGAAPRLCSGAKTQ
jgi:hypothetical protein